jgi:hypothetical protein
VIKVENQLDSAVHSDVLLTVRRKIICCKLKIRLYVLINRTENLKIASKNLLTFYSSIHFVDPVPDTLLYEVINRLNCCEKSMREEIDYC